MSGEARSLGEVIKELGELSRDDAVARLYQVADSVIADLQRCLEARELEFSAICRELARLETGSAASKVEAVTVGTTGMQTLLLYGETLVGSDGEGTVLESPAAAPGALPSLDEAKTVLLSPADAAGGFATVIIEPLVEGSAVSPQTAQSESCSSHAATPESPIPRQERGVDEELLALIQEAVGRARVRLKVAEERDEQERLRLLVALPEHLARGVLMPLIQRLPRAVQERIAEALQERGFVDVQLMNQGGMGWVFSAKREHDGRRVAIKVPQRFVAPEIAALYEREVSFLRTIAENSLDEKGWLTELVDDGVLEVGSQRYEYAALAYYEGPMRAIETGGQVLETDQALTLQELMPLFPELPAVFCAVLAEDMLEALVELHEIGFLHGDVKPANYLLSDGAAELLYPLFGEAPTRRSELIALYKRLRAVPVRVLTADFGGIREMSSFFLGDEVVDEAGEAVVVRTPAYANKTGISRVGGLGVSDRHAVAAVLYEMLSGTLAYKAKSRGGDYELPDEIDGDARRLLLKLAQQRLNDPEEDHPKTDSEAEAAKTRVFLSELCELRESHEGFLRPGLMGGLRRATSSALRRFTGRLKPPPSTGK